MRWDGMGWDGMDGWMDVYSVMAKTTWNKVQVMLFVWHLTHYFCYRINNVVWKKNVTPFSDTHKQIIDNIWSILRTVFKCLNNSI